ncbi:MerR family transcriptional regulator [Mesorhizobium sp. L-8-10]|uniref:helix-turn-helix domain-containing protein n=1 Tax=unclassified Mesorhizobium TaxID=325217 RepID=UPI001927B0DB|nr:MULTISPECIES: helix-turn-helix domain-containing protein [unclassified Mesorhizobium]BCH21955.1 MerR family transcriptional regulator [Mesorhizobium sp. L-8-3]BCH29649.1 MerR family transcriptional regulator [Mesorhizobium sp. L-8-10]
MHFLDIGDVAERSGVPPSTLRYYEEIGLIRSLGRHGLRRQFDADVLLKLSLIGLGKLAGFSLVEIAGMFGQDGRPDIPRGQLHAKANELQRQIVDLRVLRDVLRHVADCPAPTHLECPSFRKLLKAATRSRAADHSRGRRPKKLIPAGGR